MRDRLPPNVVPGELIDHTLDRLRPGVVDCEDLEVGIGLPGHGGQATPQDRSRRVDGDQHADSRRHGDLHLSGPVYRAEPSGEPLRSQLAGDLRKNLGCQSRSVVDWCCISNERLISDLPTDEGVRRPRNPRWRGRLTGKYTGTAAELPKTAADLS